MMHIVLIPKSQNTSIKMHIVLIPTIFFIHWSFTNNQFKKIDCYLFKYFGSLSLPKPLFFLGKGIIFIIH